MSATRRALLTCHDAGGTVPPMLAVGQALRDRGHEVLVLSQPSVKGRAEAAGFRFFKFSTLPDYERGKPLEEQIGVGLPMIAGKTVGDDVLSLVGAHAPDLLVVDANLAGALAAAETLAQPSVVLLHSMYKTFVDTWFADLWPLLAPGINETRHAFGLAPADGWPSVFAAHRLLSVVPALFEAPVVDPPPAMGHYGFLVPEVDAVDDAPGFAAGDGPAVLVALGTTFQHQEVVLRAVVDAIGTVGARGYVTTAGLVDAADLDVPPSVVIADFVPHRLLLPQTDVMVTHAGLGSVAASLSFGVPLVCTPISRDQPLNAERVASLGAGIALPVETAGDDVARALENVLSRPDFRRAAQSVGEASRKEGGPPAAAADLESLLDA